ncbi:glycoside hydrolase family 71 protein [Geminisphaera colitermitum]|uniref:glycoside hydrolase family 71 protein n=1 Tax=Geminisphaera colitermitum TaxID=1148786 RepID=UPI0012FE8296|nr:glycoside hydrolase family 71 protein [Geminisphaera colitermitum]
MFFQKPHHCRCIRYLPSIILGSLGALMMFAANASAAPLKLSEWKFFPFSQVDPKQNDDDVLLRRDANLQANPPGIWKIWHGDNPDASSDLVLSVSLDAKSVLVVRILSASEPVRYFDGKEWKKVGIATHTRFFESDRNRDASNSGVFLNLAAHTTRIAGEVQNRELRISIPPLPGVSDYKIELFNAGAGGTLRLHDLRVTQAPKESNPGDFALLRESVGTPAFPAKGKAARKVIVHVVPWYQPNNSKKIADAIDPQLSHLILAADEPDEVRRIEAHLLAMRKAGIDIVALDAQVRTGWKRGDNPKMVLWHNRQVDAFLEAMKNVAPDMRFCLQLDRGGGAPGSVEVWSPALKALEENYTRHPNYYHIGGRPVLLSFFLNEKMPDALLREIRKQSNTNFYFVGSIVENPGKLLGPLTRAVINSRRMDEAIDIFDGIDICPLGAHRDWLEASGHTLVPRLRSTGKPLFWGVGTGYYRRGVAFIEPAYNYLHSLWMFALRENADHVIVWTWNDFAEDHDIFPSTLKGNAVLDLMALYIEWYKRGQFPKLTKDRIFVSWPLKDGGRRAPGGGEHPTWPNLNYFAWMTAPAEFHIPGIGRVQLEAGLNVGQLGKCVVGYPTAYKLVRGRTDVFSGNIDRPMLTSARGEPENMKYRWMELSANTSG